ncbi:helix-turn-helix domain-containing protein [Streptomyces aureus]|uniref:helix-turn-helix domain-containing protein n=1 Tax=Streptomyces aureus TaxID=193461 RepID=UPI0033DD9350
MPRWKALPDELDPQVAEFVGQLRLLVDRSGLGVAGVAERTGYARTSWDRYLNGGLLAPKGAVVALAEITGTSPVHLATMWELAERAWSRSEMRHDTTMEALRIARARAALGGGGTGGSGAASSSVPSASVPSVGASVAPTGAGAGAEEPTPSTPSTPSKRGGKGWGVVASPYDGGGRFGPAPSMGPAGPSGSTGPSSTPEPEDARPVGADSVRRRRRVAVFVAGVVVVAAVSAGAVWFTRGGGKAGAAGASGKPSVSASTRSDLPPGVKCAGASCAGKDPESMGCAGQLAETTTSVTVGNALVEVRYSKACGASWARLTRAAVGDRVEVSGGGAARRTAVVGTDPNTFTPMVVVKDPGSVRACLVLSSGQRVCTS